MENDGNTYLGFIGDIAYGTRLTIQNITFENAHVQDRGGDSQYSWCGVVVGHGPMDEIGPRRRMQNARSGMSQSKTVL